MRDFTIYVFSENKEADLRLVFAIACCCFFKFVQWLIFISGQRRTDVSFSVYISGGLSLNHFEPIKFNHIVENVGDCYKIATGMFE